MSHKYHITYSIDHHPEGLTKDEVVKKADGGDLGACDSIILISMMGTPNKKEGLSTIIVSRTKDDGELTPDQMFTVWSVWTAALAEDKNLSPGRRALCQGVVETIRAALGIKLPEDS